ncbi:hypothetical protein ACPV30_02000 [Photobacterium damselae]|uniref:hypothetical protein n=1 Tax=Photobacterium damselae TaxID=38293 RepID=UPI004068C1F0
MGIKTATMAIIIGSFSTYSGLIQASVIEHTFSPNVTIFKSSSDALEITAPKTDFIAQYDVSKQTFKPITIPFEVKSKKGSPINYRLILPLSQHFCEDTITSDVSPLAALQFWLDGQPFAPTTSSLPGNNGYLFENQVRNDHTILIQYPIHPQKNTEQRCYGTLGIQAEIEL